MVQGVYMGFGIYLCQLCGLMLRSDRHHECKSAYAIHMWPPGFRTTAEMHSFNYSFPVLEPLLTNVACIDFQKHILENVKPADYSRIPSIYWDAEKGQHCTGTIWSRVAKDERIARHKFEGILSR